MSFPKPSENEEEYFAKEESRLRLGLKAKLVRTQAETDRCLAIAAVVGSSDAEIGEALRDLGFTPENVGVLPLIPMLEVAWSDGKMTYKESSLILNAARKRGMDATTDAYAKLQGLTETRPTVAYFEACNRIYAELLRGLPSAQGDVEKESTLELMTRVAEVSGGFFGLGSSIDENEQAVIAGLMDELGLAR